MIKVSQYDASLMEDIIQFRVKAYENSRRDQQKKHIWSFDEYDRVATHILMHSDQGDIVGAVRIIDDGEWSLEKYFKFDYDKEKGVEFGRLAVLQKFYNNKRVLFELIYAAALFCARINKMYFYGFAVARFKQALQRARIPFEILSPPLSPYGEDSYLVRFSINEVVAFYSNNVASK